MSQPAPSVKKAKCSGWHRCFPIDATARRYCDEFYEQCKNNLSGFLRNNLRAGDLLQIKAGQVRHLKPMDEIELREQKTGKLRRITLNKASVDAIMQLLKLRPYQDSDTLFIGQRGPLTVPSIHRLVKSWCRAINLQGNYGSHSLRKTWGYHQRVTFGVGLPELINVLITAPKGKPFNICACSRKKFETSMRTNYKIKSILIPTVFRLDT